MSGSSVSIASLLPPRQFGGLQIRVVLLCALIMFLDGYDVFSIGFLSPYYSREWHLTVAEMSTIFTVSSVAMAVGYFVIGGLADWAGRRPIVIGAAFTFGLFTLLLPLSQGFTSFLILRTLASLAFGAAIPNAVILTVEYSPPRFKAAFVAGLFALYAAGVTLSGILAAILIKEYGWRSVVVVGGVMPIIVSIAMMLGLPESIEFLAQKPKTIDRAGELLRRIVPNLPADWRSRIVGGPAPSNPVRMLFQDGRAAITLLIWVLFAINLAEVALLGVWLPTFIHSAGYSIADAVKLTLPHNFGGIAAGIVLGLALVGRAGPAAAAVVLVSELIAVALLILYGLVLHSWELAMVVGFFTGIFSSGCTAAMSAFTATFYPTEMRTTGYGAGSAAGRLAGALGPLYGGILMSSDLSAAAKFAGVALLPLLAAVAVGVLLIIQRRMRIAPALAAVANG